MSLFISIVGHFGVREKEAERFFKFLVVGTVGFIVDFGTLAFLVEVMGFIPVAANTISFSAAVVSNFTWNRYWTYPDSRSKRRRIQLLQFAVVSIVGLAIRHPTAASTPSRHRAAFCAGPRSDRWLHSGENGRYDRGPFLELLH